MRVEPAGCDESVTRAHQERRELSRVDTVAPPAPNAVRHTCTFRRIKEKSISITQNIANGVTKKENNFLTLSTCSPDMTCYPQGRAVENKPGDHWGCKL